MTDDHLYHAIRQGLDEQQDTQSSFQHSYEGETFSYTYPSPPQPFQPIPYTAGSPSDTSTNGVSLSRGRPAKSDAVRTEQKQHDASGSKNYSRNRKRGRQTGVSKQKKLAAAARRAAAPPSKASLQRAEITKKYGKNMVGADGDVKGRTRKTPGGLLEWLNDRTGEWITAAPHDLYRQEFIDIDSANNSYHEQPACGLHPLDITSNCEQLGQNSWTFDVEGSKNIIDGEGNKVMLLRKPPRRVEPPPAMEFWYHKGLLMLDPDNHPVLKWECIPRTFSSKLEGERMEALKRVFPWLKNSDFRARMPRTIQNDDGTFDPLPKYSTFGQRLSRFRDRSGLIPWVERGGTAEKTKKRGLHIIAEDADGDEETTMDESIQQSTNDGNAKMKSINGPRDLEDEYITRPVKQTRVSSDHADSLDISGPQSIQASFFSPYTQNDNIFGEQTSFTSSALPYDGQLYLPPMSTSQPETTPYNPILAEPLPNRLTEHSNMIDLRFAIPRTVDDDLNVKRALQLTRADFRSRYGFDAPFTPNGQSYATQYNIIQAKHNEMWVIDESPPTLIGISDGWFGSFGAWPPPQLSQGEILRLILSSKDIPSSNGNMDLTSTSLNEDSMYATWGDYAAYDAAGGI